MSRQMKHSGIPWIGEIPIKWDLERLQSQVVEINEKNTPLKTDFVLSLTIKDGVLPYEEKGDIGNKAKENHEEYKLAYPDTIVLNSMNILIGAVGICKYYGCVSPVYYVLKAAETSDLRFLYYIMSSTPFQKYLRKYANGILEIRLRVSAEDIMKRHIPLPPLHEQQSIADFLDKKCTEIDQMVGVQEKFIEELKAFKQSVITETVTKGLNPNVQMKATEKYWFPQIPSHWSLPSLSILCSIISKGATPSTINEDVYSKNEIRFIKCENIVANKVVNNAYYSISKEAHNAMLRSQLQPNDILFVIAGATLGKTAILSEEFTPANTNQAVSFIRLLNKKQVRYVWYVLQSEVAIEPTWRKSVQSAQPNLSMEDLGHFPIPLPPLPEQQAIAAFLDKKCSEIDQLITIKQKKIEELKEYKKSLIYEYVTGKKEVDG